MEQYYRLFSSYRLPGIVRDKLVESNTNLVFEPEHVIVIARNQVILLFKNQDSKNAERLYYLLF